MIKNAIGSDQRGKDASRFHPQIILILDPHFIAKPVNRKFQLREILFEISSHNLTKKRDTLKFKFRASIHSSESPAVNCRLYQEILLYAE
jgi:hypothetical protein